MAGILAVFIGACSLWEYNDPSHAVENSAPDTYLSLVAGDTIYAAIDTVQEIYDPISGTTILDTTWHYDFTGNPDSTILWDTLTGAFSTVMTSRQELHWWGEDPDGNVIGYWYKWNIDTAWTYTTEESGLFYLPIRTNLDVFSFSVKTMDNDSVVDTTPARLTLPIRNSNPEINFRYRSNPVKADIGNGDTTYTFPTRTFVWDIFDLDGNESITNVFYALDDPCDSCWISLDAAQQSSITLDSIPPGLHTFYLKTRDIAGAESPVIQYPDSSNTAEPAFWRVMPVRGEVLLVDDFPQNESNTTQNWYRENLNVLLGADQYSVWEIGESLPFSASDVTANLMYFNKIIWFTAYTGNETYNQAQASLTRFMTNGGHLLMIATEIKDSTFSWFPIDSLVRVNPRGRIVNDRTIASSISPALDLTTVNSISVRVHGFHIGNVIDESCAQYKSLYQLPVPAYDTLMVSDCASQDGFTFEDLGGAGIQQDGFWQLDSTGDFIRAPDIWLTAYYRENLVLRLAADDPSATLSIDYSRNGYTWTTDYAVIDSLTAEFRDVRISLIDLGNAGSQPIKLRFRGNNIGGSSSIYFDNLHLTGTKDEWTGEPAVCGLYRYSPEFNECSGKVVLLTLPVHTGSTPIFDNFYSFFDYILMEEFSE